MRVLMLNQCYYPDLAATAQLASDLGEDLVRRGHEVQVIASARTYVGSQRLPRRDEHGGVQIRRVAATGFGRANKLLRSSDYVSFLGGGLVASLAAAPPDVVIALSTPPFVSLLGLMLKRLYGSRLVHWVMDVYPDLAVEVGALPRESRITAALDACAQYLYRECDALIALDDAMKQRLIGRGVDAAKIEVIDNWCDDNITAATGERNLLRDELGLGERFTVSFSGNMGTCMDVDTIAAAMEALRDDDLHWLFIGDGNKRAGLERFVAARGLDRVTFLDYRRRSELPVSLTAAHAQLVSLDARLAGLSAPSKLYGILAAGLPVVYVGPPGVRAEHVIRDHGVGVSVRNGDVDGLVAALRALAADRARCRDMGRRARRLFEERFARPIALERHHDLLRRVAVAC